MNPDDLKKAIDFAKNNPNDPRSKELRRRMESGLLNNELSEAGLRTFEIKAPEIPQAPTTTPEVADDTDTGGSFEEGMAAHRKDAREDITKAAKGLFSDFSERGQNVIDIFKSDQDPFSKGLQLVGEVAGGAVDVAERTVQAAVTAVTTQEQETAIIEKGKALLDTPGGKAAAEAIAGGMEKWNEFKEKNPTLAENFEAAFNVAELLTIGIGGPAVTRAVGEGVDKTIEATKPVVKEATEKVVDTVADVTQTAVKKADEVAENRRQARVTKLDEQVDEAVGRIIQGKPDDIEQARRALTDIDTTDVKTYSELNERIQENIGSLSRKIDTELDKYPDPLSVDDFAKKTTVGDEVVTQNPILDALDGLENAYRLSGETPGATRIAQLRNKFETDGLTLREANDLAREYGIEFKDRAFTKLGEPKAGFNAENFENVRKGVKDVIRDKMPDDLTKELDGKISDLFSTQTLTGKMETNVQKLYQKIKNRTLAQKAGGAAADILDLLSFGTLRGFTQKLLPSNVGLKTANSLDLEKELSKNLAKIDELLKIEDPVKFNERFKNYIDEVQPGLSTRVTSGLTDADKDTLLTRLNELDAQDFVRDGQVDVELSGAIDTLKDNAERAGGLTEREYVELRVLLDEISD